jgi:cell division protein FtsN
MDEKKPEISDLIGRSKSQSNFFRFLSVFVIAFIVGFVAGLFVESKIKTPQVKKVATENIQIIGEKKEKGKPSEEIVEAPLEKKEEIVMVKPPEEITETATKPEIEKNEVEVEKPPIPPEEKTIQHENYTIQVISLHNKDRALSIMNELSKLGYKMGLKDVNVRGKKYTRVYITQISTLEEAKQIASLMKRKYYLKSNPIIRKE